MQLVQGWPKLRANFNDLTGILSQSVGPSLAIWANPVQFSLRHHGPFWSSGSLGFFRVPTFALPPIKFTCNLMTRTLPSASCLRGLTAGGYHMHPQVGANISRWRQYVQSAPVDTADFSAADAWSPAVDLVPGTPRLPLHPVLLTVKLSC